MNDYKKNFTLHFIIIIYFLLNSFIFIHSNSCIEVNFEELKESNIRVPIECQTLVDYPVFIPNNFTIEQIMERTFAQIFQTRVLTNDCREPLVRFICAFSFRECSIVSISPQLPNFVVIALPRAPCDILCSQVVQYCAVAAQTFGLELPNCDLYDNLTQGDSYPEKETIYNIGTSSYPVPCQSYGNATQEIGDADSCPIPLVLDNTRDPICSLSCPVNGVFSEGHVEAFYTLTIIFTSLSFASDLFIILTLGTQTKKRKFPAILIIYAAFLHIIWMSSWLIGAFIGIDEYLCDNKDTYPLEIHPYCTISGAVCHFFALATTITWGLVIFWMWVMVVWEISPSKLSHWTIPSLIVPLIVPTIGVIIVLSTDGYDPSLGWCFISTRTLSDSLYWAWVFGCLFLSLILVFWVTLIILKATFLAAKARQSSRRTFSKYKNIFIFAACFTLFYVVQLAYQIHRILYQDSWSESFAKWIQCNVMLEENCIMESKPSLILTYLLVIFTPGSGVLIFIAFGLEKDYIQHWISIFYLLIHCDFKTLKELDLSRKSKLSSTQSISRSISKRT
eukprot:TRINITY_DN1227_c2_g1_i1.p1 TRINITY_DN1227_c2_g1~~TRINITY_DN1227_c2_g1_i1.p1  ORF type:complete len:562 (-),score=146.73 TRINITY_DN1227_c2_g1_i1:75-1760(-)